MPPAPASHDRLSDLRSEGHLSRALIEDYEFLVVTCKVPHLEAARRLGVDRRAIEKRYSRLGRHCPGLARA